MQPGETVAAALRRIGKEAEAARKARGGRGRGGGGLQGRGDGGDDAEMKRREFEARAKSAQVRGVAEWSGSGVGGECTGEGR